MFCKRCKTSLANTGCSVQCRVEEMSCQMESHLPLAPDGAAPAFGVVVEESIDCLYLKVQTLLPASRFAKSLCSRSHMCHSYVAQVHCKDRDGLLLDIASTLADLHLQVWSVHVLCHVLTCQVRSCQTTRRRCDACKLSHCMYAGAKCGSYNHTRRQRF